MVKFALLTVGDIVDDIAVVVVVDVVVGDVVVVGDIAAAVVDSW